MSPQGGNVICATYEFALELVEIFKNLKLEETSLIFVKLQFLHPENKYLRYVSRFFSNSYEDYSLPRAICSVEKIIARYRNAGLETHSYCYDNKYPFLAITS